MDPGPWSSPGRRMDLSDGLMFPDILDRLPLDLISPVARDAHLQQQRATFTETNRKTAPKQLCSFT